MSTPAARSAWGPLPSALREALSLPALRDAAALVHAAMPPTPQYRWPVLQQRLGTEVWLKHENHTPLGAFKVRGGLVYVDRLMRAGPRPAGLVSATRGNHGQSIGFAARQHGLPVTIFVPQGNSREKNAAMQALGVTLVEVGADFQAAREAAAEFAAAHDLWMVPSFHADLVAGVASYALEWFDAVQAAGAPLDVVYVPIGMGSGACAIVAARNALGLSTQVVGVVSTGAPAYALSLAQGRAISHEVSTDLADGMACRAPDLSALAMLADHSARDDQTAWRGLSRVVQVSDAQVAEAMRTLFEATHQVAEGAGAAAWAAAMAERDALVGCRVGVVLSGGNVDRDRYASILSASLARPSHPLI